MTKAQKKKVIGIIKKDANARFRYILPDKKTCVIGGLLKAAGWKNDALNRLSARGIGILPKALNTLRKKYGLQAEASRALQGINDEAEHTKERRERLIAYLEDL